MRVGLITTSYPRFVGDPAGNFVEGHARALHALGYDVDIIAAADPGAARREPSAAGAVHRIRAAADLFYAGGAPDALERNAPRTALAAAAFSARLAAAVASRSRRQRWDAIIAHWLAPSALAALAAPRHLPLVAIAHGGDIYTLRRTRLLAPTLHALRLRAARLAFVSADLLAATRAAITSPALHAYLDTAVVQPMGIDLSGYDLLHRAPATTPPRIAIVARLAPIKGVDIALAALAHLPTPVHLVIAGDGPELPALRVLAAAVPQRHRVTFLGTIDTRRRDDLLRHASLVVVPSRPLPGGRTEGTPLIALEALAAGVPVVASATGGLCALAPAAVLVPPGHPALLAAAIDHALRRPATPATLRAAVAHLDWPQVAHVLAPTQLPA